MLQRTQRAIAGIALAAFASILSPTAASADIGGASLVSTTSTEATVTIHHSGFTAYPFTNTSSQGYKYRICWRQLNQITIPCYTNLLNSNSQTFLLQGLTVGLPIKLQVWCYCRADAFPHLKINRIVVETDFTLQPESSPPPQPSGSTVVRLRNVQTGKCLFVEAGTNHAKGWTCWPDPNMRFSLDTYPDGHKQLRHLKTGACLHGGSPSSSSIDAGPCGFIGTVVEIIDQGSGHVWIKIPVTRTYQGFPFSVVGPGGCLRASPAEGGDATKQACQPAPELMFALDPA